MFYQFLIVYTEAFWASAANRRKYFDDFARHHAFDPLNHHNWYPITVAQLTAYKVLLHLPLLVFSFFLLLYLVLEANVDVQRIDFLYRYHKNLHEALTELYPDIGLNFRVRLPLPPSLPLSSCLSFFFFSLLSLSFYHYYYYFFFDLHHTTRQIWEEDRRVEITPVGW